MLAVIFFDMSITLIGQPTSYWSNPSTVREENELYHLIMSKGVGTLMLTDLVYLTGSFLLVTFLPVRLAAALLFALIFGHFFGGSTWLCFHFKLGVTGIVIYGILLSAVIVEVILRSGQKRDLPEA